MDSIKENILKIGKIGLQEDESITRLGFSSEYFEAVDKVKEIMQKADLNVKVDKVGNIVGTRQGISDRKIIIGSHLDTVKNGGIFDGNLGVMAGIECINMLNKQKIITNHTIEIYGFNAEEGSKSFGGTFGSRAIMGLVDIEDKNLLKELKKVGVSSNDLEEVKVNTSNCDCFLEMHIEQGDKLYNDNKKIGIVSGIVGITRYKITSIGQSNHAGTTSMDKRKDALVGASKLIVKINDLAKQYGQGFVATVGTIETFPSVVCVIPQSCEFVLEVRNLEQAVIDKFVEEIISFSNLIDDCKFTYEKIIQKSATKCDKNIMKIIEDVCLSNNVTYSVMPSGAGHDANAMAHSMNIGMIFVPSKNGISHSKDEWTEFSDINIGVDILYKSLLELDRK